MRLDAFDYQLPERLIAQKPIERRTESRLMVVDRRSGDVEHTKFANLVSYLQRGDLLVVNRSRVVAARLLLARESGGAAELLVTRITGERTFEATGQPLRKLPPGTVLRAREGEFTFRIGERVGEREVRVEVISGGTVHDALRRIGHVPLPPYIRRGDDASDRERYQTVFAKEPGSAAAPTAGLHFDDALLRDLEQRGVEVMSLVLHVGLGTFMPLASDEVERNRLHQEHFEIGDDVVRGVTSAKREGRRVVAVGTTTTRVLETVFAGGVGPAAEAEDVRSAHTDRADDVALTGVTDLFIYPGYEFRVVDALLTNFHLPRSSLLLLVCAFLGRERTLACYAEAVEEEYRFFSYGDAMLIR